MIHTGRKYIHIKTKKEVYCNGRAEYMPERTPLVIYVTLADGKAKAVKESTFLKAFRIA